MRLNHSIETSNECNKERRVVSGAVMRSLLLGAVEGQIVYQY
jgi:hypothetical protein